MSPSGYGAKDIEVLEGLGPVRRRPAMYIGGTDQLAFDLPTVTTTMAWMSATLAALRAHLSAADVRGALIYLNSLTDYRFTAMYRFDGSALLNMYFFDRENPQALMTDDIPVLASYCVYVRDTKQAFSVADSLVDPRVADHAKKNIVRSYCGVPMVDGVGHMFGSVCHFDFIPREILDRDIDALEQVAPLLQETGQVRVPPIRPRSGDVAPK